MITYIKSSMSVLKALKTLFIIAAEIEILVIMVLPISYLSDQLFPYLQNINTPELYQFLVLMFVKSVIRLAGYFTLISIINDTVARHPFMMKNVRRFQSLGYVSLIYALYELGEYVLRNFGHKSSAENLWGLIETSFVDAVLIALCLFALAEVFKHGLVLRQEQDLTV